ncbi:MAG: RNA-guided endonuclease InsQ/TnpB family protein [Aridibacter sp.]
MASNIIQKSYKFRIFPSKAQTTKLEYTLDLCRELYNAALQERRDAYKLNRISISKDTQEKQLPELKKIRTDLNNVYAQVLQDVIKRVDRSFQNFFRRVKTKKGKAGFPRFQGKFRYNSFTFKQGGFKVENSKLVLSKIGKVKIKLHREIVGKVKTLTIRRDSCGKWFACFSVECEKEILKPNSKSVGVDCGIKTFAVLSDGTEIANPRFFEQDQKRLAKASCKLSATPKQSKERHKKRKVVARIHSKIKNRRSDFAHKLSRILVNKYQNIFFEKLNIKGMMEQNFLNKQISDAAWNQLINFSIYKAENAGRNCKLINPQFTSQDCSGCGHRQKMPLDIRLYDCPECHISIDRDLNASLNILSIGLNAIG